VNDSTLIAAHLAALVPDQLISDAAARTIAAGWVDGTGPMSCLATSGAIVDGLTAEIESCVRMAVTLADKEALNALAYYAEAHGSRGPQTGWSCLWL